MVEDPTRINIITMFKSNYRYIIFTEQGLEQTDHDCQFVDQADNCTFHFRYYFDGNSDNAKVWIKRRKDCY